MPLATIWRDPKVVDDKQAVAIRDVVLWAFRETLDVNLDEVEVRVRDIGRLDINYMPIGIKLDTGTDKNHNRVKRKKGLATEIADRISRSEVLKPERIGPDKSYVWIRICESAFVPIGHSDHAR